jgi:hypothetical protein
MMWRWVLIPASGCITPNCISEDLSDTILEKWNTQMQVKFSLFVDYFQYQYPDGITKKGGVDFMKGVMRQAEAFLSIFRYFCLN